jgi:hypothetical protein
MRYEHLVQINDLTRPDFPQLPRAALWIGLLARAERPQLFDPGIDEARIVGRGPNQLQVELRRGSVVAKETIRLEPGRAVEISVAGAHYAGSTLSIAIEEPEPQALFLRFVYELRGEGLPATDEERTALRSAYYHSNLDTVRHIRELAPDVL